VAQVPQDPRPAALDAATLRSGKRAMFLQRRTYRRRRLMDAARILPLIGIVLFIIPLLWPQTGDAKGEPTATSTAITYIFVIWALLIWASAVFAYYIRHWSEIWGGETPPAGGAPAPPDPADGQAG
jgi:hypothetical protein